MAHHTSDKVAKGFTMMELMSTLVIIAILVSMAIPQYRKTVERGYWRQAQDLLLTIYYGERAYLVANGKYTDPGTDWNQIYMENPSLGSSPPVTFKVTFVCNPPGCTPPKFTAKAKREGGSCNAKTIEIDQTRTFTPDPAVTLCWTGCGC